MRNIDKIRNVPCQSDAEKLVHQVAVKTEAEWEARDSVFEFSPVEPVPLWVQITNTVSSFKMRLDKAHRWAWIS